MKMKIFAVIIICFLALGCGGAVSAGGRRGSWRRICAAECHDSMRTVRILERDGSESHTKIAIITISPPYVCRCE